MGKHGYAVEYGQKLPMYWEFMETLKTDRTRESYKYSLGRWAKFLVLSWLSSIEVTNAMTWNDELPGLFYKYLDVNGSSWGSLQCYMSGVMQYLKYLESQNALPFKVSEAKKKLKRVRDTIGL